MDYLTRKRGQINMKLSRLLILIPLISTGVGVKPIMMKKNVLNDFYSIYPTVQNIEYDELSLSLNKKVNVVFSDDVDIYTKEKAYDVMSLKNVITNTTSSVNNSKTNLVLGIYSNNDLATSLVSEDLSYIPEKIDSYYLEINNKDIILVAKDSDSLYYGLSTLEFIFEQSENDIHSLKIKDYSQSELRGFIEGYYGIPWTAKERKELMRFGSRVKTNIYVYAPKDDVYHSTSWRSLYSEKDFKVLKDQVEEGRRTKTRLAWAIHPFMNNPLTADSYDTDVEIIKNKFEQVYSAGVRQFVLSADDINMFAPGHEAEQIIDVEHHAKLHKRLANELAEWVKLKGDCYKLVYVPTTYNDMDEKCAEYFQYFMDGLDENIQIMWTGAKVCASMDNMAFDSFNTYTDGTKKPFVWMNWPVNDYAINYLLLGEGEVLNKSYANDDDVEFSGLVVNPMQLAEASKMSIWACGDYAWNTFGFNQHQSYLDSFKYIESEESEAFIKIAEHLTNTSSPFEDKAFLEAESFKPLIAAYKTAYENDDYLAEETAIKDYLHDLVDACESFLNNAVNRRLVKNIEPWVNAVKYNALAADQYLYLVRNAKSLDDETLRDEYELTLHLVDEMNHQTAPNLIPGFFSIEERPAYACTTVLNPFINYLSDLIEDYIAIRLGYDTGIKYVHLGSIYKGELSNMVDGDEETFCWFGASSVIGSYIRLDLVTPTLINDVEVIFGNEDPNSLDMMFGDIELSLDGTTWTKIGETTSNRNTADTRDNPVLARFIRIRATRSDTHWVAVREITYNTLSTVEPVVKYENIGNIYEGRISNMFDGDLSTYCWFDNHVVEGSYLLVDFLQNITLEDVTITFGTNNPSLGYNDKFTGILQASSNKTNWTTIGTLNDLEESFDLRTSPIQMRYLRLYGTEEVAGWICIREIAINQIQGDEYVYIVNTLHLEEGEYEYLCDNDTSTSVHFSKGDLKDASITLDLRKTTNINSIILKQGSTLYPDDIIYFFKVYVSLDNETWTQVGDDLYRDVYDLNLDLSDDNIFARYIKIEAQGDLITWVAITEFDVNR